MWKNVYDLNVKYPYCFVTKELHIKSRIARNAPTFSRNTLSTSGGGTVGSKAV
jgi:hypothetical protein